MAFAHIWLVSVMFVRTYTGMKLFTEFRSCVKVQLAVLGSPSLIVPTVSVDVKQQ